MLFYILTCLIILALLSLLLFRKKSTRTKLPATQIKLLEQHVEYYRKLDRKGRKRFANLISIFLADTRIEGIGTEVTDLDRILIASSAVIPIFGFPEWRYRNLTNIVLYPDHFGPEFQFEGEGRNIMGMVGSGFMNGQMIVSRTALIKAFSAQSGKENAALHEFVHLLDKADGATDGLPEALLAPEYAAPWLSLMHREMHRIKENHSDLNPYALTNEAEFFAVASEYFFEKPEKFKNAHPELYDQLSRIFAQRP